MIEQIVKRYLNDQAGDTKDRRIRVWQKVLNGINSESTEHLESFGYSRRHEFVLAPLLVSLILVLVGVGAVKALNYGESVPGDRLYTLKRAVEEAQLRVANEEARQNLQLTMIMRRTQEIQKLESRILADGTLDPREEERIIQIKNEVGRTAIQLSRSEIKPKSEPSERDVNLEIADAQKIGEAVTQLLRSTEISGQDRVDKLAKIKEVVQNMREERKEEEQKEELLISETDPEPKLKDDISEEEEIDEEEKPEDLPDSEIKGEIEPEDITIKN